MAGRWHSKGCSSLPPGWPFTPFLTSCSHCSHSAGTLAEYFSHGVGLERAEDWGFRAWNDNVEQLSTWELSSSAVLCGGHWWGCRAVPCTWECLNSEGDAGDGATGTHRELDVTPAGFAAAPPGKHRILGARSCSHIWV